MNYLFRKFEGFSFEDRF